MAALVFADGVQALLSSRSEWWTYTGLLDGTPNPTS
jgi:hypothetical protein